MFAWAGVGEECLQRDTRAFGGDRNELDCGGKFPAVKIDNLPNRAPEMAVFYGM